MQKNLALLAILGTITLAACGSKTDANEKNFGIAMTQYYDKKGDLCLGTKRWPVDLSIMDLLLINQTGRAKDMAALEAAGLVKGEDTEVDVMGSMGKPTGIRSKIRRYTLTDAAKPFAQEKDVDSIGFGGKTTVKQTDLCWGKRALHKIVKWEGPMKFGDYQEAAITYTYKVNNVAEWAKKPEVQAAFPSVKRVLDGVGNEESKHSVKLTSQGWEAMGLDGAGRYQ